MDSTELLDRIARGRTDLVFELMRLPDWRDMLTDGRILPLQWFVYYGDVTAMRAVLEAGADRELRDSNGDSPISWASRHLRPGPILSLLSFGEHQVGERSHARITSDHGAGWGNGMEWNLLGDYLPESTESGAHHG